MTGIERLSKYREHLARIRVLSTYSVGSGITLSRISETDELKQLHERLRPQRTYMYLSQREQELEAVAHAKLGRYPAGTRAQLQEVTKALTEAIEEGGDEEEIKHLESLRRAVKRVSKAREGEMREVDKVINNLAELQDLQAEVNRLDMILSQLETYAPQAVKLLRIHYIEGKTPDESAESLGIVRQTFYTWRKEAVQAFNNLAV